MKKDIVWKNYLADDRRYADLINGMVFAGRQVVAVKDIVQDLDTQTGYIKASGIQKQGNIKIRDTLRKVEFGVNYIWAGIECEDYIDYSMPLRDLYYSAGEYEKQAAKIRSQIKNSNSKGLKDGEYMYRFLKSSRLRPAVTIILYCGIQEWDGPDTLHDMIDFTEIPEEFREMMPDYKMNIIEVRKMKDTSMFKTDVRQVLDFIRYSEDKTALKKLVEKEPRYREMEEDAFQVIVHYANAEELVKMKDYCRKDGKVDMCTAIREMIEDGRIEGIAEGRKEGIAEGRKEGIAEGRKEGRAEAILELLGEAIPDEVRMQIMQERDENIQRRWLKLAAGTDTIEQFVQMM